MENGAFQKAVLKSNNDIPVLWYHPHGDMSRNSVCVQSNITKYGSPWKLMEVQAVMKCFYPGWKEMSNLEFGRISSQIVDIVNKTSYIN